MHANTVDALHNAIVAAIDEAQVEVTSASPGHFRLVVRSHAFAGKSSLEKQRMVYQAIRDLMQGDNAPVHAIDEMITLAI